jgi:glycyl-tRNA synthetase
MEYQLFCKPGDDERCFDLYKHKVMEFYKYMGLPADKLKFKDHDKLAFYAKAATDILFNFPFGWEELNGIHNRTNYDLSRHQEYSGKNLNYTDPMTGEKFIPYIVEFSVGADRLFLTLIANAYTEETLENGETRVVLKLLPRLAPYKVAVLPLQKNLSEKALEVFHSLRKEFNCDYDESGSIGKRYRRHDEIGTPYCVTIDFDTLEDDSVTIRDRDSMAQERIKISDLKEYLTQKFYN